MSSHLVNYSFQSFALEKLESLFAHDDMKFYHHDDYLLLKLLVIVGCDHYFKNCVYQKWEEDSVK